REIGGVPMLLRALRPFVSHPEVLQVVVALPAMHAAAPPDWLAGLGGDGLTFVAGAAERQGSVMKALAALAPECETVLVHDAARPFVGRATIDGVIAVARGGTAAVAAVPVSDTLKEAGTDRVVRRTVPRDGLWRAQTPQGFPRALLARALGGTGQAAEATDDAMLVEGLGEPVQLVSDSAVNFKVTTAEDLALAEAWAAAHHR